MISLRQHKRTKGFGREMRQISLYITSLDRNGIYDVTQNTKLMSLFIQIIISINQILTP